MATLTFPSDVEIPEGVESFLRGARASIIIDGERREARSGETLDSFDPGTGRVIAQIASGDVADIDAAVRSSRDAYDSTWRDLKPSARAQLLFALADELETHLEDLSVLETLDNGKSKTESLYIDLAYAVAVYRYYGGWATKIHGDVLPISPLVGEAFAYTRREPLGVVGAIVPWNFPMLITSWKVAPALAAGNCVVLKPSELTSLSALRLGELALEAGFPPGVFNVVTGLGSRAGQALAEHAGVAKVSFTGSTVTGRKILQASMGNLKQVTLELGGKSANIVFADADVAAAVEGATTGIFMNQGEVCCAGSRLMVHEDVYDDVVESLVDNASRLRLGHGLADDTDMGPLVSAAQRDRVKGYIDAGVREGATLATGGDIVSTSEGYFVQPTVFVDVEGEMTIAREEIFGPVLAVQKFRTEDEAVALANASSYGLAAGVWTNNLRRAHQVAARLEAGTVWVNTYNMIDPTAPFGGFKESGYGRDLGEDGLRGYTQTKTVWVGLD